MLGLDSLLNKSTRHIPKPVVAPGAAQPSTEVKTTTDPKQSEPAAAPAPAVPAKYTDAELDKIYKEIGDIHASEFTFCIEALFNSFNGISSRLKSRKAKKTVKDAKQLEKELDRISEVYDMNEKVIEVKARTYERLKQSFEARARLNKITEASGIGQLATCIVGMLVERAEIFIDP